jgi:SAM-dependent methyltransferase
MKARGRFEGLWNIVRFNWPMYAASAGVATVLTIVAASRAPRSIRVLAGAGSLGALWTTVTSLVASHWIYDRSGLYRWNWLFDHLQTAPRRILNIHAGFDESTQPLRELFPKSEVVTCDFYDPVRNPEPSIAKARKAYPPHPETVAATVEHLPIADEGADLVLCFLAAHEIRDARDRSRFFAEVRRCCTPEADLILVEHLRDASNFLVFGPGFMHFLSRRMWMDSTAGHFRLVSESRITPFIRVFRFEPR